MPDDDALIGQNLVDVRNEERRSAESVEAELDDQYDYDFGDEWDCTHCGGEGTCDDNADPLWDCDDQAHPCHACGGSGLRRDQRIF